jgi:hypothetical protein
VIALKYSGSNLAASPLVGSLAILVLTAAAVAVPILIRNFFFPVAAAWAMTAIAVEQSMHTSLVVSAAFGVIISLVAALSFVVGRERARA